MYNQVGSPNQTCRNGSKETTVLSARCASDLFHRNYVLKRSMISARSETRDPRRTDVSQESSLQTSRRLLPTAPECVKPRVLISIVADMHKLKFINILVEKSKKWLGGLIA